MKQVRQIILHHNKLAENYLMKKIKGARGQNIWYIQKNKSKNECRFRV